VKGVAAMKRSAFTRTDVVVAIVILCILSRSAIEVKLKTGIG